MAHSGSCSGKKWFVHFEQKSLDEARLKVVEKFGVSQATIFDTYEFCKKEYGVGWARPQKVVKLFDDFVFAHPTFNYEVHALDVNSKWFSLNSISQGLRKIGEVFNQPLFLKGDKKE